MKMNYVNLMTFKEYMLLQSLDAILQKNGISAYYCFNGYADDHVCLDKRGGKWIVYVGERGNREDEKAYDSLIRACYDMCCRLANDESMLEKIKRELKEVYYSKSSSRVSRIDKGRNTRRKIAYKNASSKYAARERAKISIHLTDD